MICIHQAGNLAHAALNEVHCNLPEKYTKNVPKTSIFRVFFRQIGTIRRKVHIFYPNNFITEELLMYGACTQPTMTSSSVRYIPHIPSTPRIGQLCAYDDNLERNKICAKGVPLRSSIQKFQDDHRQPMPLTNPGPQIPVYLVSGTHFLQQL